MNFGFGDEVILSPLIHIGVVNTLYNENVSLCFADIDPDSLNMSPSSVAETIHRLYTMKNGQWVNRETGKILKGLVIYHLYGNTANTEELVKLAREFDLKLLEVCWESFGNYYLVENALAGNLGDVAVFSFSRYGPVNVGEGGGVVFKREEEYTVGERIRYHGIQTDYVEYQAIFGGFNYNLDEISCALGLAQVMRINQILGRRGQVFSYYEEFLSDVKGVKIVSRFSPRTLTPYAMVIYLPKGTKRDKLVEFLHSQGIPTKVFYPVVHKLDFYLKNLHPLCQKDLSVAEEVSQRVLALPFHGDLTEDEVHYVCEKLKKGLTLCS